MIPCDGNFKTAIAKGNHKAAEIQGQARQNSRLANFVGVKQIAIGCNKMDCDTAGYKLARYEEMSMEMKSMLERSRRHICLWVRLRYLGDLLWYWHT